MKKLLIDNKINFLFLFISIICLIGVLGLENISYKSIKWLHDGNESAIEQTAWYFFRNDIWRFPFGVNPNYGDEIGTSIVFSDSIPILALFFKLFKFILPENFQYFSFWFLICFYFQLFFSYKILKKFTNSIPFSLIGSFFFLLAPIFIFRVNLHASVSGQWLLLFALYLVFTEKIDRSKNLWFFLIIFSSLILYNFTVIILAVYSILRLLNLKFNKISIYAFLKDFTILGSILIFVLYITGYFEIRMGDVLAVGFGHYKLNLLSIIDPINSANNISWSWILPDIALSKGEEQEGFNYLGLGQILMISFSFILFFLKKNNESLASIKNDQRIKSFIIVSLILTLWALSNKISFGSQTLLEIPLNKYIFAALSVSKATGRLFWIVNYFLVFLSIIIIFKCFKEKKSIAILFAFLFIQISDISAGLKDRIGYFTDMNNSAEIKNPIWNDLLKRYKIIKTTYPWSYPGIFYNFSYAIEKNKIKKTNLAPQGRTNRKLLAQSRYQLYESFNQKNIQSDTIYIIPNVNHLRNLKKLFKDSNIGFFYRDNIWFMALNEKSLMNENDKKMFTAIKPKLLKINKNETLNFKNPDGFYGLGWSHNLGKEGIWSEGRISTILFSVEKIYGDIKLNLLCSPYITKKNKILEFDVYVNDTFNKQVKLKGKDENIEILISEKNILNSEIKIDFNFKNPISPYEVLESPDSRKLGILLKNMKLVQI